MMMMHKAKWLVLHECPRELNIWFPQNKKDELRLF